MTVKEWFEKMKGLFAEAEKELSPTPISLIGAPLTPAPPLAAQFSEAEVNAKVEEAKRLAFAEVDKLKREKAEAEAKVKEIETNARKDEIHAFCEGMAKEGKLIPAWQKMGIEEFLFNLGEADVGNGLKPFLFAEGHEKTRSQWFIDFLAEIPKVVTFKEVAGGDGKAKAVPKDFDTAVEAVMAEKKISRAKAITFCATQYPEIHEEYIANLKEGGT